MHSHVLVPLPGAHVVVVVVVVVVGALVVVVVVVVVVGGSGVVFPQGVQITSQPAPPSSAG